MDTEKQSIPISKQSRNTLAVARLVDEGVNSTEIAKALKLHIGSVSRIKNKLNKYKITNTKLLKKGKHATSKILDCFNEGTHDKENIKASDVVQIIKMQQDRIDPAVKISQNTNLDVTYTKVDLTTYRDCTTQDIAEGLIIEDKRPEIRGCSPTEGVEESNDIKELDK